MKKFLCLALTVFMLMSIFAVSSFAAEAQPTIEKVEIIDSYPISKAELNEMEYPTYPEYSEADDRINMFYSYFEYVFKITLSDGTSVEYNSYFDDEKIYEIDEDTKLYVTAYMLEGELAKALDDGDEAVPVYVECLTYKPSLEGIINFDKVESYRTGYVAEFEKPIVDKYVVSFEPVKEIAAVYEDSDYYDITNAEFNVEYYDGTKGKYKVQNIGISNDKSEFELNGDQVFSFVNSPYFGQDGEIVEDKAQVQIDYLDFYYEKVVGIKENPFESIKITDFKLEEGVGVTSVSFDITKKNGTTKSYTVNTEPFIDNEWEKYLPGGDILGVDGYYVYLATDVYGTAEDSELVIAVSLGYDIRDDYLVEAPKWLASEILDNGGSSMSFLARIIAAITNFFRMLISFFS